MLTHGRKRRLAFTALALATLFVITALAAAAPHAHESGPGSFCQLCHVAHIPGLAEDAGTHLVPPAFVLLLSVAPAPVVAFEPALFAEFGRAPPA